MNLMKMRVKWTVKYRPWVDPFDPPDQVYSFPDEHYEGEVIGTKSSFWNGDKVIVACDDGKIRKVDIEEVTIIKDKK